MAKKKTTEQFITEAIAIHGNRYDYSLVVYRSAHSKVKIICPAHGVFEQTPIAHKVQKGCRKCAGNILKTTEQFVADAIKVHGNYYNYDKAIYVSAKTKIVITCPKHGDFKQSANQHTSGKGCSHCGRERMVLLRRSATRDVVSRFTEAHKDRYDYSKFKYTGMWGKGIIICPKHGPFMQEPVSHIKGHGCDACARELTGTHKRGEYTENCTKRHDGLSHLYLVKIFDDSEEFYKVGISVHDIKVRFRKHKMPYQVKPIKVIKAEAGYVWDLEKRILSLVKGLSYKPKNKFNGHTECFSKIPKGLQKLLQSLAESEQIPLIA
ncbi:hypothetical protein [Acinetobacter sp. YH12064]|uniref:hypothetical protein n=1 Tax=Acinetobacter sp. YH12064 TaxID=2601062 RepID=UPI0015D44E31|nr:hypothetical protein [Acinetobacter sp. YH12064]